MKRAVLFLLAFFLVLSLRADAQSVTPAPPLINFQGRLAKPDGTPAVDGQVSLTFRIFAAPTGGTALWTQTMNPVLVHNGVFSVLLGNGNPLTDTVLNGTPYLEIQVGSAPPLSPRQAFVSVAFALKASTVPDGAITTSKIADGAITAGKLAATVGAAIGGVPSGYLILGYTPTAPAGYTFTGETLGNTGLWTTQTPLPQARTSRPATIVVNGKIYVFGGGSNSSVTVDTTYIYDPTTGSWTMGTPMPAPRQNAGVALVNGKVHIIGGAAPTGTSSATHFVYDPANDSWTTKAFLPISITQANAVAYGNYIYLIGGSTGSAVATNYLYDDVNDTWTPKAPMLASHSQFGIAIINQTIYVFGGWSGNNVLASAEAYDISANTWSARASMPTARGGNVAAVVNGKVSVIGGTQTPNTGTAPALTTNEEYDPLLNTWQTRPAMPIARYNCGVAVLNGSIYVIGGTTGSVALDTNGVYSPGRLYYVHQKN